MSPPETVLDAFAIDATAENAAALNWLRALQRYVENKFVGPLVTENGQIDFEELRLELKIKGRKRSARPMLELRKVGQQFVFSAWAGRKDQTFFEDMRTFTQEVRGAELECLSVQGSILELCDEMDETQLQAFANLLNSAAGVKDALDL